MRNNLYSVPSQMIGQRVEVRIFAEHLEVWYGASLVEHLERMKGCGKHAINYRQVIHSVVRKPGAFANYRYRRGLFPSLIFRVAYDHLVEHCGATADKQYLKILQTAAEGSELRVEEVLRHLIERGERITAQRVQELSIAVEAVEATRRVVHVEEVELTT